MEDYKGTIVYVDDTEMLLKMLERIIKMDFPNVNFITYSSPEQAYQNLLTDNPNLVISDYNMGINHLNGSQFLERVNEKLPSAKKILYSSDFFPDNEKIGYKYVEKCPTSSRKLMATIEDLLKH